MRYAYASNNIYIILYYYINIITGLELRIITRLSGYVIVIERLDLDFVYNFLFYNYNYNVSGEKEQHKREIFATTDQAFVPSTR